MNSLFEHDQSTKSASQVVVDPTFWLITDLVLSPFPAQYTAHSLRMIAHNPNFDHHSRTQTCHGQNMAELCNFIYPIFRHSLFWGWPPFSENGWSFLKIFVVVRLSQNNQEMSKQRLPGAVGGIFSHQFLHQSVGLMKTKGMQLLGWLYKKQMQQCWPQVLFCCQATSPVLHSFTPYSSLMSTMLALRPPNRRLVGQAARSIDTTSQMMVSQGNRP